MLIQKNTRLDKILKSTECFAAEVSEFCTFYTAHFNAKSNSWKIILAHTNGRMYV